MPEPSASSTSPDHELRSLHPAAIGVWTADGLRPLSLLVLVSLTSGGPGLGLLLPGIVALSVVPAVVRYARFRYRLSAQTLHVEGGLFFRWRRDIPLVRVQSVGVVRKLRHRMLGVVELRIEAVGGSSTEASLPALSPDEAERVRTAVLQERPVEPTAAPPPPLATMSPRDLLVYGATGGRVAVLAVILAQAQELVPAGALEGITEWFRGMGALVVAAFVIGALLVSILLSLAGTVLAFWDFTLSREDGRMVVRRGLLDERRSEVPLHRVQAVRIEENVLRRALGFASLRVIVAGQRGSETELERASVLLPIGRRADVLDLVTEVLGAEARDAVEDLRPAPPRAAAPALAAAGILAVATVLAAFLVHPLAALALLLVPVAGAWAVASRRAKGSRIDRRHAALRAGVLVRTTTVAPVPNVQSVQLRIGPLQRALDLATVHLDLAKGHATVRGLGSAGAWSDFVGLGRLLPDEATPRAYLK